MTLTVISGASRGIGHAIANDLRDKIDGDFLLLFSGNIDFENHLGVFDYLDKRLGLPEESQYDKVNIILCAAQIGTCNSIATEECEKLFKINVLGNLNIIEYFIISSARMRIVWFAGGGAAFPYPEFFGYSLSKVAVVRAVENLSKIINPDSSIIALAPGAVETDMLNIVTEAGCEVRTRTDISEPVNFVRRFITDEMDSLALNGKFLHVRDNLNIRHRDMFTLRRIE